MKFSIKLGFVTLISSTLLLSCQKQTPLTPTSANSIEKKELDAFIDDYFETKYQLLLDVPQAHDANQKMAAFALNSDVANKSIEEINELKAVRATAELKFTGIDVKSEIDYSTYKTEGSNVNFKVKLFYSYTTNGTDEETGAPITPAGYELYKFTLSKQNNTWVVVNQQQTYDDDFVPGGIDMNFDAQPASFEKSVAAYTYSGSAAANFALAHWNVVSNISGYTDYTNWGGDCTNFTSRCLREGGWKQVNYWFYKANGASGNNMNTYKRSPSWAGANNFYQYISSTGQYAGCNGNNRVTPQFTNLYVPYPYSSTATWNIFYNIVKLMKKGDIVELGNGASPATIHHNMIVTKTQNTPPYVYVSYRNATGYLPAGDRPINEMYGRILYGFYVKPSGI